MEKVFNFYNKLKKDKIPYFAFIILVLMYLLIIFADFFAIYPSTYSNRKLAYQPPSNIYVLDKNNHFKKPYTYNYIKTFNNETLSIEYHQDRSQKYKISMSGRCARGC